MLRLIRLVAVACLFLSLAFSGTIGFSDSFDGSQLDLNKWMVIRDTPFVSGGFLHLIGDSSDRSEVQSVPTFLYGEYKIVVESAADWFHSYTDSSFGLESFSPQNCHYGMTFIASGHLGLLRAEPDAQGNCTGDPKYQDYIQVPNWDLIRSGQRVFLDFKWQRGSVQLLVEGNGYSGIASSTGPAVPATPLRFRLNSDYNQAFAVDCVAELVPEPATFGLVSLALILATACARRMCARH